MATVLDEGDLGRLDAAVRAAGLGGGLGAGRSVFLKRALREAIRRALGERRCRVRSPIHGTACVREPGHAGRCRGADGSQWWRRR